MSRLSVYPKLATGAKVWVSMRLAEGDRPCYGWVPGSVAIAYGGSNPRVAVVVVAPGKPDPVRVRVPRSAVMERITDYGKRSSELAA